MCESRAIRKDIRNHKQILPPRFTQWFNLEERLYSDVRLAARRSLATMSLEGILTNRTRLSDDILHDVKEAVGSYGVTILRVDVKGLVFPGNLQEIMNRVLACRALESLPPRRSSN